MEANEVQELHEQHEQAREGSLRRVSFTMSVLAVLVAIVTVSGHRTHTDAMLAQARASDEWNLYQAKKIRQYNTQLTVNMLSALPVGDKAATAKVIDEYKAHLEKWGGELNQEQATAQEFEEDVHRQERHAARFDISEVLLEIALVITSITLLTRIRAYWYLGVAFGAAGCALAAWAFLIR